MCQQIINGPHEVSIFLQQRFCCPFCADVDQVNNYSNGVHGTVVPT